jgi:hypothetical protein
MVAYPLLLVVLGAAVLLLGKRIAVLGAAVGAILGVTFLQIFNVQADFLFEILVVGGLAVAGFVLAGMAKGIVNIVLVVLCALAGAAIALGFLNLFNLSFGFLDWVIGAVGALVGWMLYRRFNEMALVILSSLIGALLITRGLATWIPSLAEPGWLRTVAVIVLAGLGIGLQGGLIGRGKAEAEAQAQAAAAAPAPPQVAAPPPSGDTGATPPPATGG